MTWKEAAFYFTPVGILAAASVWFVHGMHLAGAALLVVGGVFVGCLVQMSRAAHRGRSAKWHLVCLPASIALTASVVVYEWPLKGAYAVSRPAMERMAAELAAGRQIDTPTWAGLFRIEKAEVRPFLIEDECMYHPSVVRLWLDADSASPTALVRCDRRTPPSRFNLGWLTSLDKRWQCVSED